MTKHDFEYGYDIDDRSRIKVHVVFVRKCEQYVDGIKFAAVYIFGINEKEINIARIDNYPHEGKRGTHIHRCKDYRVEFRNLNLKEAEILVIKIFWRNLKWLK